MIKELPPLRASQFVLSSLTILFPLLFIIHAVVHGARKTIEGFEGIIFGLFYFLVFLL
jgi:succinate-acetate transporter protein